MMAYDFDDASSQYIDYGDVPFLDGLATISGQAWVNLDDVSADHYIFSKYIVSATGQGLLFLFDLAGGGSGRSVVYNIFFQDDAIVRVEGANNSASASGWQHVLFTVDFGGVLNLWVDGSKDANSGVDATSISSFPSTSASLQVGKRSDSTSYMDGQIAECALWNRVLTDDEIIALSKGYSPRFFSNGLLWNPSLVRGSADQISGLAGTPTNSPTVSDHPPIIYPSHEIIKPPKKGKIWVNDSPSWDSGAVEQKHPGKTESSYETITIEGTVAETPPTTGASTMTYNLPTGVQAGEILILHWVSHDQNRPHVESDTPSGWTFGFSKWLVGGEGTYHGVFWKIADGTESGGTVEINYNGGTSIGLGMCYRVSGVDPIQPFNVNNYSGGVQGSSVSTWTLAADSLTGITNSSSRIMLGVHSQASRTISVLDSDLTVAESMNGTSPVSYALHLMYEDSPGTGNSAYSNTMSDTRDYSHLIYELKAKPVYSGWTDTTISVGQVIDITGLSGQLYLGIQVARQRATTNIEWIPITVKQLEIYTVSGTGNDVPDNEAPWIITGIGMGVR